MGNCKGCKHWREGGDEEFTKLVGAGTCSRVKQFWDSTEWQRVDDEEGLTDEVRRVAKATEDLAFVQDGSDYSATLITLPDFGCVMFEGEKLSVEKEG